jgi:hypothetical protein
LEVVTTRSNELRSDRQVADLIRTGIRAAGDIAGEMSYGAWDTLLEAALMSSDWDSPETVVSAVTDVSAETSDNSINSAAGWAITPGEGEWIEVRGFTGAGTTANGYFRVGASPTANKIILVGGAAIIDDAAGESITVTRGARIVNGTEFRSFSIEKEFEDLSNVFSVLVGMFPDTFSLSIGADQILTTSFGFMGKTETTPAPTATVGSGTNAAAATNDVMNGIDHVISVYEALASFDIVSASIDFANNARARLQVGTLGAASIGTGTMDVSGTLTAYFETQAALNKFRAGTESSLAFVLEDDDGNAYVIDLPRIKYSSGQAVAGGINQDVINDLAWTAIRHATLNMTIQITKFAA